MLEKTYTPQNIEDKHYKAWEDSGAFQPQEGSKNEPFTIMMPPPNVTGNLHMGHALNYTLQDVLVRYHRMRGFTTLWQPGTDHAGIATQMIVEKQLAQEGLNRQDMGREKFLEKVWQWKQESGDAIVHQQRKLGLTPDWTKHRFTMDEGLSEAVRKVFVSLYEQGLIYRDKRLVNWDPKMQTAVSDLEVDTLETQGNLWHIKYPIQGQEGRFIVVATTRPETLFGDTGVAVHPEDERYQDLIGKKAIVPFVNRPVPIVPDEHCDPEKGSGAVKITPAHDFDDFEVGNRHDLERITILDIQANLTNDVPAPFAGMNRFEARKLVVAELEKIDLLEKIDQTIHGVPHGERSGEVLEPRLMDQWFVNAKELAKDAEAAAQDGRTNILPDSGLHTYNHWMRTIQPWCISRQLWWGHQIPAWYAEDGSFFVAENAEQAHAQAKEKFGKDVELTQEEDVLDTWFSSALWPFSTLGWPENTPELETFYPTSCLITGIDIIFFWVARMMMAGLHFTGKAPFKDIFLHALVRDAKGQKMSKTKGNVINPLDVMEKYGADALRFTMTAHAAPGRDIKYSDTLVENNRNFTTKLWNAARFLESNGATFKTDFDPTTVKSDLNKWILSEFVSCLEGAEEAIARYRFDEMASTLYRFAWGTFCDWFVELTKPILFDDEVDKTETQATLGWIFGQLLHMLHPIIPFMTEELWQTLSPNCGMLITNSWPLEDDEKTRSLLKNPEISAGINWLIDLITTVRSVRSDLNVPAGAKIPACLVLENDKLNKTLTTFEPLLLRLARLENIQVLPSKNDVDNAGFVQGVLKDATVYLQVGQVIDLAEERARLNKALKKAEGELVGLEKKLSNKKFVDNAPEDVIAKNKERLAEAKSTKEKISSALESLA